MRANQLQQTYRDKFIEVCGADVNTQLTKSVCLVLWNHRERLSDMQVDLLRFHGSLATAVLQDFWYLPYLLAPKNKKGTANKPHPTAHSPNLNIIPKVLVEYILFCLQNPIFESNLVSDLPQNIFDLAATIFTLCTRKGSTEKITRNNFGLARLLVKGLFLCSNPKLHNLMLMAKHSTLFDDSL